MFTSTPQSKYYDILKIFDRIRNTTYYLIIIYLVLNYFIDHYKFSLPDSIKDSKEIFYIFLMVVLFILSLIVDYYILPKAQFITRCDFFDHSFGTKLILHQKSEDYYTNDELESGIYKFGVNFFESCYFSLNIGSKMVLKKYLKSSMLIILFLPMFFYGFKKFEQISIIAIQVLLSVYFIGGIIKLHIFNNKNNSTLDSLIQIFSTPNTKMEISKHTPYLIKLYVDYESNKSWSYIHLSGKIYEKYNGALSVKWKGIKEKYNIK